MAGKTQEQLERKKKKEIALEKPTGLIGGICTNKTGLPS